MDVISQKWFLQKRRNLIATNIIFTVATPLDIRRLTNKVEKSDPNAFIIMQSMKDSPAWMVKRRPLE